MTPDARLSFVVEVNTALSDPSRTMSEGQPHRKAKARTIDLLGLHFKAMGRVVYLAEELSVVYPGEAAFSPDVLAVLDVPQPEDDQRLAWVVADEGKGPDFILEVLHRGDRKKDLVENVERYARLGIPEYFVYDIAQERLHGHRLVGPGARRYQRIVPQGGRYSSLILGLDLALQSGALRFLQGMSELFGSEALISRLEGIVNGLEAKAEEASAKAEEASAKAEEASAKAEEASAKAEEASAKAEEASASADRALVVSREAVLTVFELRGLACTEEQLALVSACDDPALLQRWLTLAKTAGSAAEVFAAE
jgi:Uma2 family endonuclease